MSEAGIEKFIESALKDENPEHIKMAIDCIEMVKRTYSKYEPTKTILVDAYSKALMKEWDYGKEWNVIFVVV